MSKSGASELFSTLKGYINQLSDGERTPSEVASALNDWARESAESIKVRVHEEVEAAVLKMGFIKRDEFDELAARLAALEDTLAHSQAPSAKRKISLGKLATSKLATGKSAKKSSEDKGGKK